MQISVDAMKREYGEKRYPYNLWNRIRCTAAATARCLRIGRSYVIIAVR